MPDESSCGADQEESVVAGQGLGAVFSPFEQGDVIVPYFGSQIGMEVDISVLLTGFEPKRIDSIEVNLNVEGAPIGHDSFSPLDLDCDGNESATIETPVLIDVTGHPSIKSVAQLQGREAEIEVLVDGPNGVAETRVNVIIEL
jgi:hypothetical protein